MPQTITCPNCQARLQAEDAKLSLVNHPDKCVIVMDPVRVRCSNPICNQEYISIIGAFQVVCAYVPAPPAAADGPRILRPNLVMPRG